MEFFKTTSLGNDFIVFDEINLRDTNINEFVKLVCNRDNSVGGDGVVLFSDKKNIVDFRIFNADGNEAELSGNGMAAVSSVLFYLEKFKNEIVLNTKSGQKQIKLISSNENLYNLYLEIGEPDFNNKSFFPFLRKGENLFNGYKLYPISVGNPHVVAFYDYEKNDWKNFINGVINKFDFPFSTNFELVKINDNNEVNVFFYERGVGITPFSSTGSSAVMAVLKKIKNFNSINLIVEKERIKIEIKNNIIYLENKTKILYKGILM